MENAKLGDQEDTIRGGEKKNPIKSQKTSLERVSQETNSHRPGQNKEKWGKTDNLTTGLHPYPGESIFNSPALHRIVLIPHNKISRLLTWDQRFSLKNLGSC